MIGQVVSEHVYKIYSHCSALCAVTFNSVLIYCLIFTQVKHVGPYRWLLLAFAILNILISIVHALVFPFGHLTEFGYILWGNNFLNQSTMVGFGFLLAWIFLFYQTFIFLTFLFIYRFIILCSPSFLSWTQKNPRCFWITLAVVVDIIYAGSITFASAIGMSPAEKNRRAFAPIIKEVYDIDLFTENLPGYIVNAYWIPLENGEREWQWTPIAAMLSACAIIFTALLVIFYCLNRIQRQMSTLREHVASNTREMQVQLMRALIAQTLFPTFTAYIPIGFALTFPLFLEYPLGGLGTLILMSLELFPIIDPLIIMVCVKGYRPVLPKCLRRLIEMGKSSTVSTSNQHFTSQTH